MAKIVSSIKAACSQVVGSRKGQIVGFVLAGASLVSSVSAATEDFSFINDTLQGLGVALLGVIPIVGDIVTAGGPVVIKTAVYICVAAPFIAVAVWLHKKI
jgi:hypothetical protein